jgi:hypothetical protein
MIADESTHGSATDTLELCQTGAICGNATARGSTEFVSDAVAHQTEQLVVK